MERDDRRESMGAGGQRLAVTRAVGHRGGGEHRVPAVRWRDRPGSTLAEMLVALTITAVVAAIGGAALVAAERQLRLATTTADGVRMLRETESVLRGELRAADPDSIVLRGDTAVEILAHVGVSVVCAAAGRELVLPPAVSSAGPAYSIWRLPPAPGDVALVFDRASSSGWFRANVDSTATRTDGAGCPPGSGLVSMTDWMARVQSTRLSLSRALPDSLIAGAPVRLLRRGRYVLLKGSDRSWSLSYRPCSALGVCGSSQPVSGPLAAHADSGLRFSWNASARQLTVVVRAPSIRPGAAGVSRRLIISFPGATSVP